MDLVTVTADDMGEGEHEEEEIMLAEDKPENSDLLNRVVDMNIGVEGFDNMNGMILGENDDDQAEQLEQYDDAMMKKLSMDFNGDETFTDPEEEMTDPFSNLEEQSIGQDSA